MFEKYTSCIKDFLCETGKINFCFMTIGVSHCNLMCKIHLMIHKCLTTCRSVKCTASMTNSFHACLEYTVMSNNELKMCVI
jgi:hypothetical protein